MSSGLYIYRSNTERGDHFNSASRSEGVEMPGLGDRYEVTELTWFTSERRWAIWDIGHRDFVRDDRKYKKAKTIWKDTRENAEHYCELLNRSRSTGRSILARTALTDLSPSQAAHFANQPKRKTKPVSTFTKCKQCGSMYRGEHAC